MHFNVRTSDRLILSYGEPAGIPPSGVESVEAAESTLAQIIAAYNTPNGGITLAADGTVATLPVPPPDPASVAFRAQIVSIAQSSAGITLANLTAAQVKALAAVLLYKAGGVDPATLQVLPLNQWV